MGPGPPYMSTTSCNMGPGTPKVFLYRDIRTRRLQYGARTSRHGHKNPRYGAGDPQSVPIWGQEDPNMQTGSPVWAQRPPSVRPETPVSLAGAH